MLNEGNNCPGQQSRQLFPSFEIWRVPETIYLVSAIALSVCVVFGISNHVQHIALDHMDVRDGTIVNVGTSTILLWFFAPLYLNPESLLTAPIAWFALAGLIVPALAMTLHTESVRLMGPSLTAGLTTTYPIFAIVLAVVALGEMVTGRILIGTAIVVGSIVFVALRAPQTHASWPLWAVAIPLGAALARGLSHNVIKFGLDELPNPMTAALVGSSTSLFVLLAWKTTNGRPMAHWNAGYYWFALCGVLNGIGLVGLNAALEMGDVVIVSPLIAATPAFTLITGWLFFRREVLQWSSIAAILAMSCGCILIVTR